MSDGMDAQVPAIQSEPDLTASCLPDASLGGYRTESIGLVSLVPVAETYESGAGISESTERKTEPPQSAGFLQSRFWARFKSDSGWKSYRFALRTEAGRDHRVVADSTVCVMERRLGPGLTFAYVPHGPEIVSGPVQSGAGTETVENAVEGSAVIGSSPTGSAVVESALTGSAAANSAPTGSAAAGSAAGPDGTGSQTRFLADLGSRLRPFLDRSCVFIRFDPASYYSEQPADEKNGTDATAGREVSCGRPAFGKPLAKGQDIQPPDTVVVDLRNTEEELLAAMKSKWRYNIRLAAKKGVEVVQAGLEELETFYRLYRTTSARDRIAIHPLSYYRCLFELAATPGSTGTTGGVNGRGSVEIIEPTPDVRLWLARHGSETLAAIITVFYGTQAVYLYGASGDEHRNLMPAYALQWAAMRAARDAGCTSYDLYGIPPTDDPGHPMAGLYRFKTGFGGEIRHYPGAWDYVYKPLPYAAYRLAERARNFWYKTVKKRLGR